MCSEGQKNWVWWALKDSATHSRLVHMVGVESRQWSESDVMDIQQGLQNSEGIQYGYCFLLLLLLFFSNSDCAWPWDHLHTGRRHSPYL